MKLLEKLRKTAGKDIAAAGIALVLVFVSGIFLMLHMQGEQKDEWTVVCMGDSIFGNVAHSPTIPEIMAQETGISILNGAFGGTCMSDTNHDGRNNLFENDLDMCNLAEAIAYRDFTVQKFGISGNVFKLDYFDYFLKQLSKVDFSKVEVLFIEHGTNDYNASARLDDAENPYNKGTFGGALRYSLRLLQKAYPQLKIVLVTPAYCYFIDEEGNFAGDSDTRDFGYGTLPAFVALEKQIAEEFGVPVIDQYYGSGINAGNIEQYTVDGLHFNEEGRRLLAEPLIAWLEEEMKK